MALITLDFETFYSQQYSLNKMPIVEYINHREFHIHGVGVKYGNRATRYIEGKTNIAKYLINTFSSGNKHTLLCHNTHFDGLILSTKFNVTPYRYADTMALARGLYPGLGASLARLCELCFPDDPTIRKGIELEESKGQRFLDKKQAKVLSDYCKNDVNLTRACYDYLVDNLCEEEHELIHIITRMFCEPMLILNKKLVAEVYKELIQAKENTINAALSIVPQSKIPKNIKHFLGSPLLFPAFIKSLGIKVPMKISKTTNKPIPAFANDDLDFQKLQVDYPQYEELWDARIAVKSTQEISRCTRLLNSTVKRNRLPVPLKYSGAANTHRLGGDGGINLQNLGRKSRLRSALTAPRGYKVVVIDSANIEARVVCALAGQDDVITMFKQGIDTYCIMAERIYGHTVVKHRSKEDDDWRFVGKVARLMLGYGAGSAKFAHTLRSGGQGEKVPITDADASHIVYGVFRPDNAKIVKLWGIADGWIQHMNNEKAKPITYNCITIRYRCLELPNGMLLHYPNLKWTPDNPLEDAGRGQWSYFDGTKRVNIYGGKIIENVVQALARIIVFYQMIGIDQFLLKEKIGRTVHTIHDETVSLVHTKASQYAANYMLEAMRKAPYWMPDIPLEAEYTIGDVYEKP